MQTEQYNTARSSAVKVERTDQRFVRVHGRDPVRMVQGLVTNDIAGAGAERAVYAAVLTPKGKMVADVRVLRHGDELLLEVAASALENVIAHLRKFVPPLFARFEQTEQWHCTSVFGPAAAHEVQKAFGVDVTTLKEDEVIHSGDDVMIVATSYADVPGFDIVVGDASRAVVSAALSEVGEASLDTLEVLRVEARTPRWGAELDENTIPLEAGLRDRAISQSKGCYTGQEVIVRILHRGHVNWILRGIRIGATAAPARDTPLFDSAGKKVGRITSAVHSPLHAQTIALAYVRREVEPPAELHLAEPGGPDVTVLEDRVVASR